MDELLQIAKSFQNSSINIKKQEHHDVDVVQLFVEDIMLKKREESIDGYVAPFVLQFRGNGFIQTEHSRQPLPYDMFEIPLTNETELTLHENTLTLTFDVGDRRYTISKQP